MNLSVNFPCRSSFLPYNPDVSFGKDFSFMSHIIAQPCVGVKDTACVAVCPVDCIHPTKDEANFAAEEMLFIDLDTCIDCGLCVDECPVNAIFPQEDLPAEWAAFIEKNGAYYKK
jgi:ferredoxin